MNRRSIIALFFFVLMASLSSSTLYAEIIKIEPAEVSRLKTDGVTLIDIRQQSEWAATGIVPGSVLITFINGDGQINPDWLSKVRAASAPDKPVILICRSGNRSAAAARLLSEKAGYATVYDATGGILAWSKAAYPVIPAPDR